MRVLPEYLREPRHQRVNLRRHARMWLNQHGRLGETDGAGPDHGAHERQVRRTEVRRREPADVFHVQGEPADGQFRAEDQQPHAFDERVLVGVGAAGFRFQGASGRR